MNEKAEFLSRFTELSAEILRLRVEVNKFHYMKKAIESCRNEKSAEIVIEMIEKAERFNP